MIEVLEIPGVLASMAEGAITLAGFSAVFRAFKGGKDPDGYSWVRLSVVMEGGLVVAAACYLPVLFSSAGIGIDYSWRLSSLLVLIWAVPRQNMPTWRILMAERPYPELFWLAGPLGVSASVTSLVNVASLSPLSFYSTHLLAVLLLLGNVGSIFVAQFRVEHTSGKR